MAYFWTNTIWYIILAALTIMQLAYVLYNAKARWRLLAFYLTASGLGFVFEANCFMIFKSYNYYPMIFPGSTINDGLAGNLFSQSSVAATALWIATANMNYRYNLLFACLYCLVEELFLLLGIYQHNWYRTWMTFPLLIIYFELVKIMYIKLNKRFTPALHYIYLLLGLWPIHFALSVWPFMISGKAMVYTYLLPDPLSNSTIMLILNYLLMFNVTYASLFLLADWWWKPVGVLALWLAGYLQQKLQLLYVQDGWFLPYSAVTIIGMFLYVYLLDKFYEQLKEGPALS